MKQLLQVGVVSKENQAKILTEEEKELLWTKGLLGDSTSLDTVIFYNGLFFALIIEYRQLQNHPCQIEIVEHSETFPEIHWNVHCILKPSRWLKGLLNLSKIVIHHQNKTSPKRCFVRVFKLHIHVHVHVHVQSVVPKSCSCIYLQSLKIQSHTNMLVFQNTTGPLKLINDIKQFCKTVCIEGYETNHSLRATPTS